MRLTHLLFLLPALLFSCTKHDSNDVAPKDVPEAVRTSLTDRFPTATGVEWEKAGTNYEAEFELNAVDHKVLLAPAGTILKYKYNIGVAELPEAVETALGRSYAGQTYDDIERVHEGRSETYLYQVELEDAGPDRDLLYSADGQPQPQSMYWD